MSSIKIIARSGKLTEGGVIRCKGFGWWELDVDYRLLERLKQLLTEAGVIEMPGDLKDTPNHEGFAHVFEITVRGKVSDKVVAAIEEVIATVKAEGKELH